MNRSVFLGINYQLSCHVCMYFSAEESKDITYDEPKSRCISIKAELLLESRRTRNKKGLLDITYQGFEVKELSKGPL